jgi:ADP-ribose pyrophosphatase
MDRPRAQFPLNKPLADSLGWRRHGTHYLYLSTWYDLRQDEITLPGGERTTFTFVEHPGFASVVPVTADGRIVLIRSFRYTVDQWVWEVPAGGFGNQPGRSPAEVVRAELAEETGYAIRGELRHVASYFHGIGNSHTRAHVFLATGVEPAGPQALDDTEQIEIHPLPIARALDLVRTGEMEDGASSFALLLCEPYLRGWTDGRDGSDRQRDGP